MSENILQSSKATLQRGAIHADGQLTVTATDVTFVPFNQQFGLGPYSFSRGSIANACASTAKAGGLLPISTDAIKISLDDGEVYEFILANTAQWLQTLNS
ncbi:hypothetical protein HR45_04610 [Shewanella mangrovi]|uniref:GRAM domain-containing protein n=1 Tax=Shewanella mangrovi TaxID=1515746 RepID=A0A094LU34_9GAMM|nr:hypothetical protein [Shewanella mangrovi]KFZ38708.1 hypothetical protein HR45_04610 [Shewanella mangrovi]